MYQKKYIRKQANWSDKIDTFIFDVVSDKELNADHIKKIQNKMDLYLEPNLKLIINKVEKINRPENAKIKHFYSEIDE